MLTNEQMQTLYFFCYRNGIVYYDLQLEIADHLAEGIEDLWKKNPAMSFEEALKTTYADFGKDGFRQLMEARKEELQRSRRKNEWAAFRQYIRFPRLLLPMALFMVFTAPYLFDVMEPMALSAVYAILFFVAMLVGSIYMDLRHEQPRQRLLVLERQGATIFLSLLQVPCIVFSLIFFTKSFWADYAWFYPAVILFMTLALIFSMAKYEVYMKQYMAARRYYPLAF
jgi:hypothetical protein